MTARTTRRIHQPNSRYCACIKTASLNKKLGRGATITACAAPPAQALQRDLFAAKSKNPVGTRPHRLRQQVAACLEKKNQSPRDCYRLRCSTRASTAARPFRGQIQKPGRCPTAPLAPASRRLSQQKEPVASRLLPGNLACRGVKLIYGSAIKTSHKCQRISKLQNSNRRQKGGVRDSKP